MRKNLTTIAVLGLTAYLAITGVSALASALARINNEPSIFKKVAPITYKITDPDNAGTGGTGFHLRNSSGRVYMVTNAHVCDVTTYPFVLAQKGDFKIRLQIIDVSDSTDLCVLQPIPGNEALEMADRVSNGERAYLVGHPRLQPSTLKSGYIAGDDVVDISYCKGLFGTKGGMLDKEPCIKTLRATVASLEGQPGNSGSPVVNDSGDVIGVLFAGNSTGTSLLVPLSKLREFINAL